LNDTDAADLAVLKAELRDIRADVNALAEEERRTRTRLHNLEGLAQGLVDVQKQRRRDEQRREKNLARRLNMILVCASVAAVISPVVTALLTGR